MQHDRDYCSHENVAFCRTFRFPRRRIGAFFSRVEKGRKNDAAETESVFGLVGTFNVTSTTNEVTPGDTVDKSPLFLRASPRRVLFRPLRPRDETTPGCDQIAVRDARTKKALDNYAVH